MGTNADVPQLIRAAVQVSNLKKAAAFYSKFLGADGREIRGSRQHLDCGSVILALLDPTSVGEQAKPNPDYVYFSLQDLEKAFGRARELDRRSPPF